MTLTLSAAGQAALAAAKNAALDDIFDAVDAGAGPGTITVYSGAKPATTATAPTGTELATFTLADPAFSPAAGQTKTLDADPDLSSTADASGAPGWARVADSDGTAVFDGTVGTSGTDFITGSSPWTLGQVVNLTAGAVSIP